MSKPVIICIDDEKVVLNSLKTELKQTFGEEYTIEVAEGGEDALELFNELINDGCDVPLVISDYIMPDLKGDEVLISIHKKDPRTLKIMLTGQATMEGVANVINNAQLYRYITKPWEPNDFAMTVKQALKSYAQDKMLEKQNAELKELNQNLEIKVEERTLEVLKKNILLEEQKKEITDSIQYALRIQEALLPGVDLFKSAFTDYFIFYRPKDIVSGDFYWIAEVEKQIVVAVADCTGHGVPGAFMSMLGSAFLKEIVVNGYITHTSVILKKLRKEIINALGQQGKIGEAKDGMDIAICTISKVTQLLQFAGANNPVYIVTDKEKGYDKIKKYTEQQHSILDSVSDNKVIIEIKGDRMPIAIHDNMKDFNCTEFQLEKEDVIYLSSDGFADQFGGENGKKLMYKPFKKILLENCTQDMKEQGQILEIKFDKWKNGHNKIYEQIDDICVIGIKI